MFYPAAARIPARSEFKVFSRRWASSVAERSYLGKLRRIHEKRNFFVPQNKENRYLALEYRLGNEYDVNWTLQKYGISFAGENSYHNLHLRYLLMNAKGKTDINKALHFPGVVADNHQRYYAATPNVVCAKPENIGAVELLTVEKIMAGMIRQLTGSKDLFINDGSAGSHRLAGVNIRTITNNPNTALYLHHLLSPISTKVINFEPNIIVYHASDFIPDPAIHELKSTPFTLYYLLKGVDLLNENEDVHLIPEADKEDLAKRESVVLMIGGGTSLSELRSALTTCSDYLHLKKGHVPINASILANTAGNTAIVLDPLSILTKKTIPRGLFSADDSIWTSNGVYRTFQAVTHNNLDFPREKGDIVEDFGKSGKYITQPLTRLASKDLVGSKPGALVYLLSDASCALPPIGRLQPSAALHFWKQGYTGGTIRKPFYGNSNKISLLPNAGDWENSLQKILQETNIPVFVVNTQSKKGDLTPENLQKIMDTILDGSAAKADVAQIQGLDIGAISKLPPLDPELLNPARGWTSKAEYQKAATQLGSQLKS